MSSWFSWAASTQRVDEVEVSEGSPPPEKGGERSPRNKARGDRPKQRRKAKRKSREEKAGPPRAQREGARCAACGRRVPEPATVESIEQHALHCAKSGDSWASAAGRNRADPSSITGRAIQLVDGHFAYVARVRPRLVRRWLPPRHELVYEGGERGEVLLDVGVSKIGGAPFRFLAPDEEAERSALKAARLEAELRDARVEIEGLEKAERGAARDRDAATRRLEETTLCVVCPPTGVPAEGRVVARNSLPAAGMDAPKDAALSPCGHRICRRCAGRCRAETRECPVCRTRIAAVLRVYDA